MKQAPFCFEDIDRYDWPPSRRIRRRKRKPTLRGVLAQAKRAGVQVAAAQVNGDGSIIITPGQPPDVICRDFEANRIASEWN